MAILGKVAGTMLKDNLLRNGVDLVIDSNLVYFDVLNRRVGIGTVTPGNVLTVNGAATLSNIFANNNVLTSLSGNLILNAVNGNISANNLRITNIGSPTSNTDAVSKAYVDSSIIAISSPNLTVSNGSTTTNIVLNSETLTLAGTANQIVSTVSDNTITLSLTSNVTVSNSIIAGNQIRGYLTGAIGANTPNSGAFTTLTTTGAANINTMTAATIAAGTIGNSGASLVGTLATASQTNITSVGTLTSLTVSGATTTGSLTTSGGGQSIGYHTGPIGANTPNSGAFTTLTVSGAANLNTLTAATITAATIGNTGATLTGTLSTAAQTNITSVGTLTGLAVSGNSTVASITSTTNGQFIGYHTGAIGANVPNTGTFTSVTITGTNNANIFIANAVYANTIGNTGSTLVGIIGTNAQPFITSIGSLGSLSVVGNATVGNISSTGQLTGYHTGAIGANTPNTGAFTSITAASIGLTQNATANVFIANAVYANTVGNTGSTLVGTVGTNAQPFITSVGTLTSLSVSGNTTVGNITATGTGGQLIGYHTGAIGANVPNTGAFTNVTMSGTANINTMTAATIAAGTIGNSGTLLTGTLTTASQPNVTSVGTLTGLTVTGNATVGNLRTSGQIIGYFNGVIGANAPNSATFTNLVVSNTLTLNGNSVSTSSNIGNFYLSQNTITVTNTNGDINLTPNGNGLVIVNSTQALTLPVGNNLNRPASPTEGMIRFNTASNVLEIYDGTDWQVVSSTIATTIISDTFTGDGVTTSFTLTQDSTTGGTLVTINGVIQIPDVAYSITGTTLQFVEAPVSTDIIEARILTTTSSVTAIATGNASVSFDSAVNGYSILFEVSNNNKVIISNLNTIVNNTLRVGNIIPQANVAYNLGNANFRFDNLWLSGTTIYLGSLTLKDNNGKFGVYDASGNNPVELSSSSINNTPIGNATPSTGVFTNVRINGTANINTMTAASIAAATIGNSGAAISGATGAFTGAVTGNNFTGVAVLAGTIGNTGTTLTGTLSTAAQTNITSVGTLTSLAVSGNATVASLTSTSNGQFIGYHTGAIGANLPNTGAFTTLTASGNINIDAGTLFTDSINNRVGIGNTAPAHVLSVTGNASISSTLTIGTGIFWPNGNAFTSGITYTASATAPTSPRTGDQWYDTGEDILYTRVNDGSSNFWLDISTLPSTFGNVTIAGNLTVSGNVNSHVLPSASNLFTLGSSTRYWSTIYGVSVNAQYADLAEKYSSDVDLTPGEVVIFGGQKEITKTAIEHDDRVAGIVSTNPAYVMNSSIDGYPIALQGRVPCWVKGPIAKGQMIVTSDIPGVATALDKSKYQLGCVVGKCLESIDDSEIKLIEVVVGRL